MVIVRGESAEIERWRDELAKIYAPRRRVFAIPDGVSLPAALADKQAAAEPVAYVCKGTTCSAPVRSLAALVNLTRG
jgi:uncharacterized protein YyaL (SSP411 family)